MDDDPETIEGLRKTTVRVGASDVAVTLEDARAMRKALQGALKASDLDARDDLVAWAQGPAWIAPDGHVRVGPWTLEAHGDELVLRYREPARAHRATVVWAGGEWKVTRVALETAAR
jgi:hypothetical protein